MIAKVNVPSSGKVKLSEDILLYYSNDSVMTDQSIANATLYASTLDCNESPFDGLEKIVAYYPAASIKAHDSGIALGGNNGTLVGGNGDDTFLFAGENCTIENFLAGDCISLQPNFLFGASQFNSSTGILKLFVTEGAVQKTISIATDDSLLPVIIWQQPVGDDEPSAISIYDEGSTQVLGDMQFNNSNPAVATYVTLLGNYGDLGVQTDTDDSGYKKGGKEYYNMLYSVEASQANSTIIGSHNPNTIIIVSGNKNVLTGGLGADKFEFENGGGVITDFGIGATKSHYTGGITFETSPTVTAYDRNDPFTYAEGIDVLKVHGKITSVAIEGKGDADTKKNNTFTAYVTYDADFDGTDDYTVALTNIYKKPAKGNIWQTDEAAAKTLKIWDMQTAGSSLTSLSSSQIAALFVDVDDIRGDSTGAGKNIADLDSIMVDKAKGLGFTSEDIKTMNDIPSTNFIAGSNGQNLGGTDTSKRTTLKK